MTYKTYKTYKSYTTYASYATDKLGKTFRRLYKSANCNLKKIPKIVIIIADKHYAKIKRSVPVRFGKAMRRMLRGGGRMRLRFGKTGGRVLLLSYIKV